ncbi:site-specific integrase [Leptolyngbyaceae cyanobacterium UHCC 1019]
MSQLDQANERLKNALVRVRIEQIGKKLYLQATLPPKPTSHETRKHQQRITLDIAATPTGIAIAEREARKVGALLDCKQFDWLPYLTARHKPPETVEEWIAQFESEKRPQIAAITWETDYADVFKRLPQSKMLTVDLLLKAVEASKANSKTRKRFCTALGQLAKTAGLTVDFKPLQGTYSARKVDPRSLPTDQQIVDFYQALINPGWKWVYGMMATFGLRNHEVFYLDLDELLQGGESVRVIESKTNGHQAWAYHPDWIETFNLREVIKPPVTGKQHSDYGDRVTCYLRRAKMPFAPYDLRHCWAIRTVRYGIPDAFAAQQMGHSVAVHHDTYHHWITAAQHEEAHERAKLRSDRPVAPKILA